MQGVKFYAENDGPQLTAQAVFRNNPSIDAILIAEYRDGADVLVGECWYDRKARFEDGYVIHISRIVAFDPKTQILVTKNSVYLLAKKGEV